MKDYLKTPFLIFISVAIFIFILFVDTVFYYVPSFIRIYRYEREIAIVLAFLCLYPIIKKIFRKFNLSLKQNLWFLGAGIVFMILLLFLPQLVLKKYLVIWDNNPFLAEFPLIWNIVSTVCAICVVIALMLLLFNMKELIFYNPTRYAILGFHALISAILIITVALNFFENRYSFQPAKPFYIDLNWYSRAVIIIMGGLFIFNSYRRSWIDVLNKNEKITAFIIMLIILPICIYIYLSRLIVPVYAYSITVKGFTISSMGFIIVYTTFSFIGILFRLPTANFYDRVTKEIISFREVSQIIDSKQNINQSIDSIMRYAMESTSSDACWFELIDNKGKSTKITSSVNLPDSLSRNMALEVKNDLTRLIIASKSPIIVNDVFKDDRTIYMKLMGMPWRSILAVPLIKENRVSGILYAGKNGNYAFSQDDLNMLKTYIFQINIVLENSRFIQNSLENEKRKWELNSFNEICQKLFPGKIPEIKDYQIDVLEFQREGHTRTWWDFFDDGFGHLGTITASIQRNSIESAFCLSEIKSIANTVFKIEKSPSEILERTSHIFSEMSFENILMNFSLSIVDIGTGRMSITGIGKYSVVHYNSVSKDTRFFEINIKNFGVLNISEPEEVTVNINQSDIVLLFNLSAKELNKDNLSRIFMRKAYMDIKKFKKFLSEYKNKVFKSDLVQDDIVIIILKRSRF